jgi:hypothetical protein
VPVRSDYYSKELEGACLYARWSISYRTRGSPPVFTNLPRGVVFSETQKA